MAIGWTPKHVETYPLNELTKPQFLVLALETAEKLGWGVVYLSPTGLIAYTSNEMFSWKSEVKIIVENGVAQLTSTSTGNEMGDFGKNKKKIQAFITQFEEMKLSMPPEEISTRYESLQAHFAQEEQDILTLPPVTFKEQVKEFVSFFIPTKDYFITPLIMDVNILIFILMVLSGVSFMSPTSESLINWGANFRPVTLDGQLWRLLTCCFLHIGFIHLLMNMYALLYIGVLLEPILGKTRFIAAYLLTGITASITSLWWHDFTVSAGASGAIFGLYGVFLALLTTKLIEENARKALLSSIAIFVIFNLTYGLKGGVDNAAHIGGLIGGLIIGYAFLPSLKQNDNSKLAHSTIGLLTLFIVLASFFVTNKIPNDMGIYTQKMAIFSENESKAMAIFQSLDGSLDDKQLADFKKIGNDNWNENIKLLDEIDKLKLPEEIQKRNQYIKKYCQLRLTACELYCKTIAEKTTKYNDAISNNGKEIDAIVMKIEGKDGK